MSDDDKRVRGRSDEEIRAIAERTKLEYGVLRPRPMNSEYGVVRRCRPVNIVKCLESGSVPTVYGRKQLAFVVKDDLELGDADGKTEFNKDVVTISVKRSVNEEARVGVGRARMTLAHELGHAVMHHGTALFRMIDAAGSTDLAKECPYESAEHQAKVFAAAFLIHDEDAAEMRDAEEISIEFGVSIEAAKICVKRLKKKVERAQSAERVNKLAEQTKAVLLGKRDIQKPEYLPDSCIICSNETLILISGNKVLCDTCKFVGDRFHGGHADE
jgi:Zn-dependent peptidase ImmA (M78 family)